MSEFAVITAALADLVAADPLFWENNVPVFDTWHKPALVKLTAAGGALQVCAVVGISKIDYADRQHVLGPAVTVRVLCFENLALNRTGITADDLAQSVASAMRRADIAGTVFELELTTIQPADPAEFPVKLGEGNQHVLVAVEAETIARVTYDPAQTEAPTVESADGMITITPAAGAEETFYTLDGSNPTRESQPYSEPFAAVAGLTVKARSYTAGQRASAITIL